jgi:hypothetical protein
MTAACSEQRSAAASMPRSLSSSSSRDAVVSLDHEFLVDLFREESRLAVELLRRCARIEVDHARVAMASIDLSQVTPVEYRADAVFVLHDDEGCPVAGLIVEVQLHEKERKLMTWPAYVANLRAKLNCAALLLVIAPDPAVARWASRPIDLGHPGFQLTPIVIGYDHIPRILDRAVALALPRLSMLSAMAHKELAIVEIALEAISQLPEDQRRLYCGYLMRVLPAQIRQELELRMSHSKNDLLQALYEAYREDGRKEGREDGRKEGLEEGRKQVLEDLRIAVSRLRKPGSTILPTTSSPHLTWCLTRKSWSSSSPHWGRAIPPARLALCSAACAPGRRPSEHDRLTAASQ